MLTKEQIEKWLDKQIEAQKNRNLYVDEDIEFSNLSFYTTKEIQVSNIVKLAELIGKETYEVYVYRYWSDGKLAHIKKEFIYKGYHVFGIMKIGDDK